MLVPIVGGIVWSAWHAARWGYLPPPFFHEPDDTFADWFNPAIWARNPGIYDAWMSIYPPLSFVFLRVAGIDACYTLRGEWDSSAGLAARDCDWLGLLAIGLLFAGNVVLCWKTFARVDRRTALPRTVCVALGMPMLHGLERGNLVLLAFPALALAFGPLLRGARGRALAAGVAVNLKVYLIGSVFALLLVRRWLRAELALIGCALVYLVSFALLGRGTPGEILASLQYFSQLPPDNILDVWYSTTYQTFVALIENGRYPLVSLLGSRVVEGLQVALPALQHATQGAILLSAAATWLRPEAVPVHRAVTLGVMAALVTSEPGAYAQVFFFYFVMLEPWRGAGRCWAILACYLLALPLEIPIDRMAEIPRDSYVAGTTVLVNYDIVLGSFLRPLLVMSVAWGLSWETLRAVAADVRGQGWATRRRFAADAPLLPGVRAPA